MVAKSKFMNWRLDRTGRTTYNITTLANRAVTALGALAYKTARGTSDVAINQAYCDLLRDSPLIKYLIYETAAYASLHSLPSSTPTFCPDFLGDIIRALPSERLDLDGERIVAVRITGLES